MSIPVRQSTARTVIVGPILDSTGVAVTTAVVGDLKISKNGGAPAALNGSATLTHRNTGHYSLALTTSDLDTVGQAEVVIDATTNAMPVKPLIVIEEAVYDLFYASGAAGFLAPTVVGRTLDVSATGEAGVDWANVGGQGTAVNLSATTVGVVASLTAMAANCITATAIQTGAFTAAKFAAGAFDAVWTVAARILTAATNITSTGGTTVPQTGDSFARLGAPVGASISADIAAVAAAAATAVWAAGTRVLTAGTNIVLAKGVGITGFNDLSSAQVTTAVDASTTAATVATNLNTTVSSRLAAASYTTPPTAIQNADALLTRDWTAVGVPAARSVLNALRFLRNKWAIVAGVLTVNAEDDATPAWTGSVTTAAGNPVDSIDPT